MPSPDKHGPIALKHYLDIHTTAMENFRARGYISHDSLSVEKREDGQDVSYIIEGDIYCRGPLRITVWKRLDVAGNAGHIDPLVKTTRYSYNVEIGGHHTVFRYDNAHAHPGHATPHHRHSHDLITGDELQIEHIGTEGWPTLGEVIGEVESFYWENIELLGQMTSQEIVAKAIESLS